MEEKWFHKSVEETKRQLETDEIKGLTEEQVLEKRKKYGSNELKEKKFIC